MAGSEQVVTPSEPLATGDGQRWHWLEESDIGESAFSQRNANVGQKERLVSGAAGAMLVLNGLMRRDLKGLLLAGLGGALVYRGTTAHCPMYETLGIDTAQPGRLAQRQASYATHVTKSFLIDRPAEVLYAYWRDFTNLPQFMTHLKSVRMKDDQRSHWVAAAPRLAGGEVEWDAEITADEPNSRIAWCSLPGGDVSHRGSIEFSRSFGDRGTVVRVDLEYHPPAGQLGKWVAKFFGEEPAQQIRDDLRNFKRIMEIGEVPTTEGQPRGSCLGRH
jgi:uncharacterized membrane protein